MKKLLLAGLLFVAPLFAQVPVISYSPNTPLQEGQGVTIACTANCIGLTWKVNGVTGGSAATGTISGTDSSATYTAPASIVPNNNVGGCPVSYNDALWNVPVAGLPVVSNWMGNPFLNSAWFISYAKLADGHKGIISGAPGISDAFHISLANNNTPLVTIQGIKNIPYPQTPERGRESGIYNWNFTDQHVDVVNTDDCSVSDVYADNITTTSCGGAQTCYTGSSAAHLAANSYSRNGGVDAGGNMITPYLPHLSEIKAGVIKHAVHWNMPRDVDSGANDLMWPATWGTGYCNAKEVVGLSGFPTGSGYTASTTITFSGGGGSGTVWTPDITGGVITGAHITHSYVTGWTSAPTVIVSDPGGGTGAILTATIGLPCWPYGARIALDQTYLAQHAHTGCTAGTNCIPDGPGLVMATALANYGGMVLDNQSNSGPWLFNVADDILEDTSVRSSITSMLSKLNISDFVVYDQTNLGESSATNTHHATGCNDYQPGQPCSSVQVLPNNNLNYTPPGASWVTATNASGTSLAIDMPLQPAEIGTPDAEIWILAGDYSGSKGTSGGYQIPFWINGTATKNVAWSLQASPYGSITTGGIYTPPASVSTTGLQDVATAILNGDPNSAVSVYINLLPNAGNYAPNTLRIDVGTSSNVTDGNGNYWIGNVGYRGGDPTNQNAPWTYYKNSATSVNEKPIYNTSTWWQSDASYTFIVPNGDYKVRVMSGWDLQGSGNQAKISEEDWNHMPLMVWSNDNGYDGKSGGSGGIKGLFWNMMKDAAYPYATNSNSDFVFGDKVVNNRLTVGVGGANAGPNGGFTACSNIAGRYCSPLPQLSGIDIEPDASAAHLAIGVTNAISQTYPTAFLDDKPVTTAGGQLGLYPQDWYTGLTDPATGAVSLTWSIVSGPGTITQTTKMWTPGQVFPFAIYTAPTTQPAANTGVIIKAQSQDNPSISATIRLQLAGSGTGPTSTPTFFK